MYNSLSHKTKQFFWLILKMSIVIACGYFIYLKLFQNEHLSFHTFKTILSENDILSSRNIIILLLFSSFNWCFEILKWQTVVSFCSPITLRFAAIQSLASLTTSLITPNRIGEYPAKALYFHNNKRKQILKLNFLHNISQLLATVVFGSLGLLALGFNTKISIDFTKFYTATLAIVSIALLLYFSFSRLEYFNIQLQKAKLFLNEIPSLIKRKTMALSIARYLVFTHQFYFLILCFTIQISYLEAISAITAMYLLASIIPVISLFDAVLKGAVAIFIFALFDVIEVKILCISLLMWIFNFVFPSIIGSYFVLTFKPKLTT